MLRMSTLFLRTLRDDPADATVTSHKLLVRAGYVRPIAAGIFSWLPLGVIALRNVERVIREEMDAAGFQEVHFPALLPKDAYGKPQTAEQILQGIAKGTIDTDRLQQDVRKLAALGQPQYVRDLLGQGYDLETIYSPYKQRMAQVLELNPDAIDLRDPTLRMAISDKGDMNLFDYERSLRKDSRWQYTQSANDEVSTAVLGVLRDFGFRG